MHSVIEELSLIGIVPVIAIDDPDKAVPLARALIEGGLPAAEITFRTEAGEEAIRRIASQVPEMLVGAGTVLTRAQADRAAAAGARFMVSPGFNPVVTRHVIRMGIPMLPGTASPGEMERAMSMGLEVVKFFPAEQNGGAAMLKALAGPYTRLRWMPTGGINPQNMMEYLNFDRVAACGGTWMVKKQLIAHCRWDEITALSRQAVQTMLGFSLHHVELPVGAVCRAACDAVDALFGFVPGGGPVECRGTAGAGGWIALGTNHVDRALYHLKRRGAAFEESTRETDGSGRTAAICLRGEFGGFGIRLVANK